MQDAKQVGSKTNHNQLVVAVGNSWVVCKSKTYAGKTYYFNTLSGEAVWNLSNAEVAKAKKWTKSLGEKSAANMKECPEPTEPPMEDKNNTETLSQYIYNKKVINNRFTNEPYPMATFVTPPYNHVMPPCTAAGPIGLNYNPEVWSVPPTHQIFIAPAVSPVVNQMQTPVNVQYRDEQNVSVHSSAPLTRRFNNQNSNYSRPRHASPKYYNRYRNNNRYGHGHFQRKFQDKPNDLRDVLSSIRKRRQSHDGVRDNPDVNDSHNISSNVLSSIRKRRQSLDSVRDFKDNTDENDSNNYEDREPDNPSTSNEYYSDAEINWVEEKKFDTKANNKIDVSCLRELAPHDADPDRWYIAVDRTILLDHFNFLKKLIDSDLDCQLLVPREELTALQEMSTSRTEIPRQAERAKRAYDYVLSQFDDHCAVQGEEDILNCCLNVAENNYHVILLSNNEELLDSSTDIKMFSMLELKAFLAKAKEHGRKSPVISIPPESAIKIIIPNDYNKDQANTPKSACETFERIPTENKVQQKQDEKEDNGNENSNNVTSKVIETKVQQKRDEKQGNSNENSTDVTAKQNVDPSDISKTYNKQQRDTGVQTDFATPSKGGKIRLKRGTSNQSSNIECNDRNTGKKQYRWRGKRNATCDASNQTNNGFTNCHNISTSTFEDLEKTSDKDTGRGTSQVSVESQTEENVEGSDTSSLCMHRPVHQKIVIDETSTSGVISNTSASNRDDESVTNNYIFEASPQVEENIQTRRDEWVSQFVQIMEEVLSQVLRQNKPTAMHLTPPPWTMQEALQCFLSSNDYYGDVINAANNLSNTISKISDEKGNINMNLRPTDFMEMYSHGVYLVDALQGRASNCEDLQTATDLLAKLYKDIQEPNLDSSHNDTFGDGEQSHEISNAPHSTCIQHEPINDSVNEHTRYNLRSRKSTSDEQNKPTTVQKQKFKRNIDIEASFFNSLNLHKRISQEIGEPSQKLESSELEFDNERASYENNTRYINGYSSDDRLDDKESNVRNCPEYMERFQREPLDLDQLDYSGNYDDNNYCMDRYEDECDDRELYAGQRDLNHEKKQPEQVKEPSPAQSPDINGNKVGNMIIDAFMDKLRDTFIQILQFCNNSEKLLKEPGMKKTIHEKAKKTYIYVEDIIKTLNGILHRDMYQSDSVQIVLKTGGIDVDFNTQTFSQHRDTIMKCSDQANTLYEAVGVIVTATKT